MSVINRYAPREGLVELVGKDLARKFSLEELRELDHFYRTSKVGKRWAAVQPLLTDDLQRIYFGAKLQSPDAAAALKR
jgi:hypothetical protein